jgi:hypothetical protein
LRLSQVNRVIPAVFLGVVAFISISRVVAVHKGKELCKTKVFYTSINRIDL